MAENTNYIGVAMGLDVTDLKAGLSEANKQIQLANSEFKAASSGMEDWTKSTEGLTAKVKQLDTILTAQKSKLSGLQAEYARVAAEQGESSEAARKLQVQINNQQAVVNSTEREFNNYTQTLKAATDGNLDLANASLKAGKAVETTGNDATDAGGKMDGLKGVAAGVGAGLAALGAAAVGAIGGFLSLAESTRETRTQLGQLQTAFETAGLSAENAESTFVELSGVLGDQQQATEAAQQIAQLAQSEQELAEYTTIATGVYATFGESLKVEGLMEAINHTSELGTVQGTLADALEWSGVNVDDFNAQLATCTTEQERQALITSTLNGLYGEAADKYKEVNADIIAAQEAEALLAQTTAELGAIAEPIMTTLKMLAVELLQSITPFVELIGEGLTGAFSGAADAGEKLAEGLGGVLNVIVERITSLLPTVLDIVLQLIPSIANTLLSQIPILLDTVLSLVTSILQLLGQLLPDILAKIVEIIPQIIDSITDAVPVLLQAATTLLLSLVQAISVILPKLIAELPRIIEAILDAVTQSIPLLLSAAEQLFMALIDCLPDIISALTKALPRVISTIVDFVVKSTPLLLEGALTLLGSILSALPVIVEELTKALPDIIVTILAALTDALPLLLQAAVSLFGQIVAAVDKFLPKLIAILPEIISTITGVLLDNLGSIIQAGIQLLVGLVKGIVQAIPQLAKMIPQLITAIVKGLASGLKSLTTAGLDIVKGIWSGIKDGADWIKKKITGFASDVAGWFKKAFKIKSPSRLMADEVGEFIGEGVGVGIVDSIPNVKKQLSKFGAFVSDNLGNIKTGLSINADGTANGNTNKGSNTVINAGMNISYNGSLSRKQIKQLENDQYTAIKLKLRAEGLV